MLVIASAPALIIGLSGLEGLVVSNLIIELNGSPVGSIPTLENTYSSPRSKRASASVITFEIL